MPSPPSTSPSSTSSFAIQALCNVLPATQPPPTHTPLLLQTAGPHQHLSAFRPPPPKKRKACDMDPEGEQKQEDEEREAHNDEDEEETAPSPAASAATAHAPITASTTQPPVPTSFQTALMVKAADGFFPATFWSHLSGREVEMTWDHNSPMRFILMTTYKRCTLRSLNKQLVSFNTQNPMRCCCIISVVAVIPMQPLGPSNLIAERVYAARANQDRVPYYIWRASKPIISPMPAPVYPLPPLVAPPFLSLPSSAANPKQEQPAPPAPAPISTTTSSISSTATNLVIHLNHTIHIPLPALREAVMMMMTTTAAAAANNNLGHQ